MSVTVPLGDLRPIIGKRADAAHYSEEATIITKNGQPHAAIISYEAYRSLPSTEPNDPPFTHQK